MRRLRVRLPRTRLQWGITLLALTLLVYGAMNAFAAANTVPESGADVNDVAITANTLKPGDCAGLTLTNLVEGNGVLNGTAGNDLILGGSGVDTIDGGDGDDCVVGGGGVDSLVGGNGTDVCIGGGDGDTIDGTCETSVP